MFEEYAKLLIAKGLNVKKNQIVIIKAPVEVYPFVEVLTQKAFEAGARDVIVRYRDEIITHQRYMHAPMDIFEKVPSYEADFHNQTSEQGACYLTLVGNDPNLMKDVNMDRMVSYNKAFRKATIPYRNRLDFMECQWCIAAVATKPWADAVYPYEKDNVSKLWNDIFQVSRVQQDWNHRKQEFQWIVDTLNQMQIYSLHYSNHLGTDLTVELPDQYLFSGGGSTLKDGTYYFPNIPTEEVFSAPFKHGVNGKLYASKPLNHNGVLVKDFWFSFHHGKVVDYDAKEGKDVLTSILRTDENASYLGEVALVPYDSPISKMDRIFYETLIDENASCHFALGQSYAECLKGGLDMNEKELASHGMNQSLAHVDFMVGTSDLSIIAETKDHKEIPVFVNGNYSRYFDQ